MPLCDVSREFLGGQEAKTPSEMARWGPYHLAPQRETRAGLTELDNDLAKVVRMPRHAEEALVADGLALRVIPPEGVLLRVAHGLHCEADDEEDDADDVPACAEGVLRVLRHVGRVEHGHGQRDGPDPDHLEDPEAEEGEELVALVVEAVVLARLDDAEEEEAREARRPEHDEDGGDDLARMVVAAEREGDDCE